MKDDMVRFLNKLNQLKDNAVLMGGYVTSEQIEEIFPELLDNQKEFLKDYLEKNHIGIDEPIDVTQYLSDSELNILDMYMESLKEIENIDDGKMRVLKMEAIAGSKTSRDALIEQYLGTVVDTAKLYAGQGTPLIDLIGEGNVALTLAISSCECVDDPDDIDPLVMKMVMNSMEELVGGDTNESNVEDKTLKLVEKVRKAAKDLSDELLRKVTVEELAENSKLSKKSIRDAIGISAELSDLIEDEVNDRE